MYYYYNISVYQDHIVGDAQVVEIIPGSTVTDIARVLYQEGIIKDTQFFQVYVSINGLGSQLYAGAYEFYRGQSIASIAHKIANGEILRDRYVFSIPEGSNIPQIAQAAERQGFCSAEAFLAAIEASDFREDRRDEGVIYNLEGYLYPATYRFDFKPTPKQLIDEFYSYALLYQSELELPPGFPLNMDEVIILASILEKESQYDGERERVAGVFLNRLAIDMPLQSCATVQYILPEFKDILSEADTLIESPYNTYIYGGLPVGPISNPSLMALEAVLNPEEHDYFFFVAGATGRHIFSRTYEDHLAAIAILE